MRDAVNTSLWVWRPHPYGRHPPAGMSLRCPGWSGFPRFRGAAPEGGCCRRDAVNTSL